MPLRSLRFHKVAVAVATAFATLPVTSIAADYTSWAVPTTVEVVSGGIVIIGDFGNANGCSQTNMIIYPNTQVDYDVVVSMALTALTSEREMRFYADDCVPFAFHGGTINRARNGQGIFIR